MSALAAAGLSGGLSLLGSAIGAVSAKRQQERNIKFQREANAQNIAFQRETNEWNEGLMREGWARDDQAVQRRSADMAKAGFSPLLAAGAAANPSTTANVSAPHVQAPRQDAPIFQPDMILNAINAGLGAIKTISDVRNQKLQAESTVRVNDARQRNIDIDTILKEEDVIRRTGTQKLPIYDDKGKQIGKTMVPIHSKGTDMTQAEKMAYDLWLSKKTGVRTTDPLHAHNLKKSTDASAFASSAMGRYMNKAADLMLLNSLLQGANSIVSMFTKFGSKK